MLLIEIAYFLLLLRSVEALFEIIEPSVDLKVLSFLLCGELMFLETKKRLY